MLSAPLTTSGGRSLLLLTGKRRGFVTCFTINNLCNDNDTCFPLERGGLSHDLQFKMARNTMD